MKTSNALLAILLLLTILSTGCSKSNGNDNTTPVVKNDTLSAGWTKIKVNQYVGIFYGGDVFFKNNLVGYISDNNTNIFKSTDGGSSWNSISSKP